MSEAFAKAMDDYSGLSRTENGALGHSGSGSLLADFMFRVSGYRSKDESEIALDFGRLYDEEPKLAVKMMFLVGDVRGGMGERRTFRACLKWLSEHHADVFGKVLGLVPEYTRWDAVTDLACGSGKVAELAMSLVRDRLAEDLSERAAGRPVSLLAKWMPSCNTSSKESRKKARKLMRGLCMHERSYRKTLADLRGHIGVIEAKMSSGDWQGIDYEAVPSKANALYRNAFLRRDGERRREYLEALKRGGAKINSKVSFPHDIVHAYIDGSSDWRGRVSQADDALEGMWKSLPDLVGGAGGTLCVVDGSGSMLTPVGGGSSATAWEVANALGIYFSERMSGPLQDCFVTFSSHPEFVSMRGMESLKDRINECVEHDDCSNTDIAAVFRLILKLAKDRGMSQDDLPSTVLVLSDMEFDEGCGGAGVTLFGELRDEYAQAGYRLPRLVFWNICSRTNVVPLRENELGVTLVSGFSPAVADMVLSGDLDPLSAIVRKLGSERYDAVDRALAD